MPASRGTRPEWSATTGRRGFLAAAGAACVAAAGCRPLFREKAEPARPDPDVTATVRALTRVRQLQDDYAAVGRAHPSLAADLRAFSKRHATQAAALRARLPAGHPAARTPTASPSTGASTSLAGLVRAETAAADAFAAAALDVSPTLAQLLASLSAGAAAHVQLLAGVRR